MATNSKQLKPLDIPFKEFMPGQVIQSVQFNDDMRDIEDTVNELVNEHNIVSEELSNHVDNLDNPHQVDAHQTGTYNATEIDEFFQDVKNGNLNDNAITNRVLDDECVETRNLKDNSITTSKLDFAVGSQIDISQNMSITDRYTKSETDELIRSKVGEGTYSKDELDTKFEQVQAGQILDKSISINQIKDSVGTLLDISQNQSIIDRYTRDEVDLLIQNNALPRDWGSILEEDNNIPVIPTKEITLPVANHMKVNTCTVSESSILDIDILENVGARGEFNTVGERLNSFDSQIKDIANEIGTETLNTTAQDLKGAINEVFQNASNGKVLIANAITGMGIEASPSDTFQELANKILLIVPTVCGNIIVDTTNLEITEGGTGTFTVHLDQAPTKNQVINIASSNEKVTVNPTLLTFTPSNYNTTQTVTISTEDDAIEDNGYTLTLTLSSNNVDNVVINVTVKDNDLIISWHTLTSDEATGMNSTNYLLATYSGTNSNVLIPNTLNGKNVQMNVAPNKAFDTNGVIENLKFDNNVSGSFKQSGSQLPKIKRIENIGNLGALEYTNSGTLTKLSIITENSKCSSLKLTDDKNLIKLDGLDKLTGLKSCEQTLKGCTSLERLSSFPPNLSNAKLMCWQCTNLKSVPPISMELSQWTNMLSDCPNLKELTVTAMKGCDLSIIGYNGTDASLKQDTFTFKCNYNSDMYKSYRDMICNSKKSSEKIFIETLDSNSNPITDIVMWGDSMTRAGNNTMSNMPDQLSTMVTNDVMIYNYGISGNTIQTAGTRFEKHPETYGKTSVIWLGTNNASITGEEMCSLIQSNFLDKLTTDKYIIVGLLTTNYTDEKNQAFINTFGDKFLNIREYFLSNMWTISGLTATDQDNIDLSNNLIPSSFRVDQTHLNPTGGKIVATAIKEKLLSLGYINSTQIV